MDYATEPTTLRCRDCGHELLTPARLFADRDRTCLQCDGTMEVVSRGSLDPAPVSPWH